MPIRTSFFSQEEFIKALRDWFAGQALAGALEDSTMQTSGKSLASWAYKQADAMLSEREKGAE